MNASLRELLTERTQLARGMLEAECARLDGDPGYTLEEVAEEMKTIVDACAVSE